MVLRSGFAVDVRNNSGIYMNTSSKTIKPARIFSSGSPFTKSPDILHSV